MRHINPQNMRHFNSHAHVERDILIPFNVVFSFISTHTLTWSVTAVKAVPVVFAMISTHTLTWSVTETSTKDDSKD